jgi:hypothetical protein
MPSLQWSPVWHEAVCERCWLREGTDAKREEEIVRADPHYIPGALRAGTPRPDDAFELPVKPKRGWVSFSRGTYQHGGSPRDFIYRKYDVLSYDTDVWAWVLEHRDRLQNLEMVESISETPEQASRCWRVPLTIAIAHAIKYHAGGHERIGIPEKLWTIYDTNWGVLRPGLWELLFKAPDTDGNQQYEGEKDVSNASASGTSRPRAT